MLVVSAAVAQSVADSNVPDGNSTPKDATKMDAVVRAFKDECVEHSDSGACIKGKVLNLLEDALRKDSSKVKIQLKYLLRKKNVESSIMRARMRHLQNFTRDAKILISSSFVSWILLNT